ncbi:ATP-binding cassette domain-containing protein [Chloroflexota bacterium]
MIKVKSLSKSFGTLQAVKELNLFIDPGEIYGLVGPDGAGKTTTLRLLVGALKPDEGSIIIGGEDLHKRTEQARSKLGYLSQRFSLYEDLSVMENIRFFAEVRGISRMEWYDRSLEILDFVGLVDYKDRLAGVLSGGMKQKLGLASALVGLPRVLLLDEPTTGVDPVTRQDFWKLLVRLVSQTEISKNKVTVLITTPYMDEAVRCSRIGFMQHGELIAEGSPSQMRSELDGRIFILRSSKLRAAASISSQIPGVENVRLFGDRIHLRMQEGMQQQAVDNLKQRLDQEDMQVSSIDQVQASLEDVFIFLAENGIGTPAGTSLELSQKHSTALLKFMELVPPARYNWCLSGSANLRLQGMDVQVHDLDIHCRQEDIKFVQEALADHMISPVRVLETGKIHSLDGRASISEVEIDLIANMQVQLDTGEWQDLVDLDQKIRMDWQGKQLPLLPLSIEAQIYRVLGRMEKHHLVRDFIDSGGID